MWWMNDGRGGTGEAYQRGDKSRMAYGTGRRAKVIGMRTTGNVCSGREKAAPREHYSLAKCMRQESQWWVFEAACPQV